MANFNHLENQVNYGLIHLLAADRTFREHLIRALMDNEVDPRDIDFSPGKPLNGGLTPDVDVVHIPTGKILHHLEIELGRIDRKQEELYPSTTFHIVGKGSSGDFSLTDILRFVKTRSNSEIPEQLRRRYQEFAKLTERGLNGKKDSGKRELVSPDVLSHYFVRKLIEELSAQGIEIKNTLKQPDAGSLTVNTVGEKGFSLRTYSPQSGSVSLLNIRNGEPKVRLSSSQHLLNHLGEAAAKHWGREMSRILGIDFNKFSNRNIPFNMERLSPRSVAKIVTETLKK